MGEKKDLQTVFQIYFHNKYVFNNFLATKLIESSNFKFSSFQTYLILRYIKDEKTNRLIPKSQELKDYHTFLNNILFKYMSINKCVFSYQKNLSVYDAVYLHKNSKSYFKTDIKNFFQSISKKLIIKHLEMNISQYPVNKQILKYFTFISNIVTYDNYLPVGFSTSPILSNTILYEFDNIMEKYCENNNIIYSRYSDDLIFSSQDYKVLRDLEQIITQHLTDLYGGDFQLNKEKTQFLDKTDKLVILGLTITPDNHITVSNQTKKNIKHLLYYYINDKNKFNDFLKLRYSNSIIKAYGILNYINEIDKNFLFKLRNKYGNFIIDKFLHGDKSQ